MNLISPKNRKFPLLLASIAAMGSLTCNAGLFDFFSTNKKVTGIGGERYQNAVTEHLRVSVETRTYNLFGRPARDESKPQYQTLSVKPISELPPRSKPRRVAPKRIGSRVVPVRISRNRTKTKATGAPQNAVAQPFQAAGRIGTKSKRQRSYRGGRKTSAAPAAAQGGWRAFFRWFQPKT